MAHPEQTEAQAPGPAARFTVPPGDYYVYCSPPQHNGFGMHANLTVTP